MKKKPIVSIDNYEHCRESLAEYLADGLLQRLSYLASDWEGSDPHPSLIVMRVNGVQVTGSVDSFQNRALYGPLCEHLERWLDEVNGFQERPLVRWKRKVFEFLHR